MVAMISRFMPATDFNPVTAHYRPTLRGGMIAPGFGGGKRCWRFHSIGNRSGQAEAEAEAQRKGQ
jgi:hypothetical protein